MVWENCDVSDGECRGPISKTRANVGDTPGLTTRHRRRGSDPIYTDYLTTTRVDRLRITAHKPVEGLGFPLRETVTILLIFG